VGGVRDAPNNPRWGGADQPRIQGISMNRLALRRLQDQPPAAAMAGPSALDDLAGTWSEQEADTFQAAIAPLEQVDPDLWG